MKLSVIIVNYNVLHFLRQCLFSVNRAAEKSNEKFGKNSCEIFVVDNNSSDDSCKMVKESFPNIILIENKENTGFSRANNQALRIAKGEYQLLLNPDTVVGENTFLKTVEFMDSHSEAGALGVKMIDGKGHFLPESKRALPTPEVSFYKIFGLSDIFPKSKKFGRYRLTYLDKNKNHEVEILSGAFMLIRKTVLEKAGLLDETFFMYGEDIDLSYRIISEGFKNYYFSETQIIHYKGESTKKGSLNYIYVFYNAMIIFAKKHFSAGKFSPFVFILHLAVLLRATVAVFINFLKLLMFPVIDILLFIAGFALISNFSEIFKIENQRFCSDDLLFLSSVFYILVWLITISITKGYFKRISINSFLKSSAIGFLIIFFSRVFLYNFVRLENNSIFLVIVLVISGSFLIRRLLSNFGNLKFGLIQNKTQRIIIASGKEEAQRILKILDDSQIPYEYLGRITEEIPEKTFEYLGTIDKTEDLFKKYKPNQIIFSLTDNKTETVISTFEKLEKFSVKLKTKVPNSTTIIS
jgi:GT2 family glycosyltransferase